MNTALPRTYFRLKVDVEPLKQILRKYADQVPLSLSVQPLSHLHNVLQRSPAWWHLQLPRQATTQQQWRSSEHAWLTSTRYVQYGNHSLVLVFNSHPNSLGFGLSGILERDCFQTKARFACWSWGYNVQGPESVSEH